MTIECFVLLLIMMNSTNDKSRDIQDFLKKIKEGGEEDKFKDMLNKMPVAQKVENFLRENQPTEFMQEIQGYVDPSTGKITREDQIAGANYFGVPESVRNANKFMSGYTKGDFSDPEFIRNFKIIQEFNRKA